MPANFRELSGNAAAIETVPTDHDVDAAEDTVDAVRRVPASLDDTIRHYIENNPYTTAAIALGLGWVIGRSHRPF
jgi:hypothetical protein